MIEDLDKMILFYIGPFPINATIFFTWIVMFVLCLISIFVTRNLKDTQKVSRLQIVLEMIVLGIRKQIYEVSQDNPAKYLPVIKHSCKCRIVFIAGHLGYLCQTVFSRPDMLTRSF